MPSTYNSGQGSPKKREINPKDYKCLVKTKANSLTYFLSYCSKCQSFSEYHISNSPSLACEFYD